jgi:hypothetical protein
VLFRGTASRLPEGGHSPAGAVAMLFCEPRTRRLGAQACVPKRRCGRGLWRALALAIAASSIACSPIVRDAPFRGAKDRITEVSLLGPFDGQVVDGATSEPIEGATVVGVWSYDRGDGLIAPFGSETIEVKTDRAGRYRIPEAPLRIRGRHVRLVAFSLIVYRRGYVGYRSDATFEGRPRTDFTLRHNRVELRKWRDTDSHAEHLLFLAAPPVVQQLARWEQEAANLDLYSALGGFGEAGVEPVGPDAPVLQLLDASGLLRPEEVRRRTGFAGAFNVGELGDLARTHFYHGVHLQAIDREEEWDVAYRVWKDPPGGLDPVIETFEATLPGVQPTGEVTDETWVYDTESVRAVAFLDRERSIGVLLTCGGKQCVDIDAAIILANYAYDRLEEIALVEAPATPPAAPPGGPKPPSPAATPTEEE